MAPTASACLPACASSFLRQQSRHANCSWDAMLLHVRCSKWTAE
jgi:hypothetical protein